MGPRRNRTPMSPGRAALESFDVFEILEKAPHCVIVIDERAAVVYQNAASRELDGRIRAAHGEALLDAVRLALADSGAAASTRSRCPSPQRRGRVRRTPM